jgi:ABC-type amino acid transport substrate-binding protein
VNPPFEYVSDGRKVGFEVALIREIARPPHLRASFVNTRWEVILQQMQEGRYDCIVGEGRHTVSVHPEYLLHIQ